MTTRPKAWSAWLEAKGDPSAKQKLGPKFENFTMMIEAVRSGLGVAMMPYLYVENDLKMGRLLAPFGPALTCVQGYYITYPDHMADTPKVRAFADWLVQTSSHELPPS